NYRLLGRGGGGAAASHVSMKGPCPLQADGVTGLGLPPPSRYAHLDCRLYVPGWLRFRLEDRGHIFSRHNHVFRRDGSLWLGSSSDVLAQGPRKWASERKMVWPHDRSHQRKSASLRPSATALAARLPNTTSFCARCVQFASLALGRYHIAGHLLHAPLECRRGIYCGRAAELGEHSKIGGAPPFAAVARQPGRGRTDVNVAHAARERNWQRDRH